jgi:hypothetical protein
MRRLKAGEPEIRFLGPDLDVSAQNRMLIPTTGPCWSMSNS